ncbi:hypothetical protein [Qipengyuania sp. ASV99]|uniref:hypothetical protein n=1 Tax=Qipengyuania sp. ASV99 TaxID=3399681 RepID=UPI003A4C7E6D
MSIAAHLTRAAAFAIGAASLSACAGSYTGPVEVTRFVAERPAALGEMLGQGTITLDFPEEMQNQTARNAFAAAIADELSALGYTVVLDGSAAAAQLATVRTSRNPLASEGSRGPVSVGVGGSTGSYGSGVGLGIGINLGGGQNGPTVLTDLAVRISLVGGETLWEGRAQQPVSLRSPYADVDASARTLAAALFKDFPGGNGETVSIDVDQLQE